MISLKRKFKHRLFIFLVCLATLLVVLPLLFLLGCLILKGLPSLNYEFITSVPTGPQEAGGGMVHALCGTFFIILIAFFLSVPFGVLCGVYLSEYGKGMLPCVLRYCSDLMTGVPSIVIGIFSYGLIVVYNKSFSAFAGGFALALIMFPIIIRSTEEVLKLMPKDIRKSALALGLPKWKVTIFVVLRGSRSSLLTGIILAISRAMGETAPLLFTAFGNMYFSTSFSEPIATLPVQIYTYATSPIEKWQNQAWSGALLLVLLVIGLNFGVRLLSGRFHLGIGPRHINFSLRKKWIRK